MNIEDFRSFCLSKTGVTEDFPFDDTTLVFKVGGKMFALTDLNDVFSINLKCEPDKAISLREQYPAIAPGYHMNKKHWNTIIIDGSIDERMLLSLTEDSYNLVVAGLPAKIRKELSLQE